MRNILAINFNHDGSGAILSDGRLAAFVNTERFSRRRKHPGLRESDLAELLDQAQLSIDLIDVVLLCNLGTMESTDIVAEHGSDLHETWPEFSLSDGGRRVAIGGRNIPCVLNPDHQILHAAVAFLTSPFDSAMVLAEDPTGCAAFIGRGVDLDPIPDELGDFQAPNFYLDASIDLFGSALFGAGKVMGLAPYGADVGRAPLERGAVRGYRQIVEAAADAPVVLEEGPHRWNAGVAFLVQEVLNDQLTSVLGRLHQAGRRADVDPHLCLSGGTALNSVANQVSFECSPFTAVHLHPACGDDGTAIGAVLWYWHTVLRHPRTSFANRDLMYSVRTYDDRIEESIRQFGGSVEVERPTDFLGTVSGYLEEGRIVGWFHGSSEVGPRALGHRSILADPRRPGMTDVINLQVKARERFRPFAPAVLAEHAHSWFGLADSPFMLRVAHVLRDGVPAVTHVDRTARIQTVALDDAPEFHALIDRFHRTTGVPMLLNTSFNAGGEPIVETPVDAIRCFLSTGIDHLAFPGIVLHRTDAPRGPCAPPTLPSVASTLLPGGRP
jgi:carbamoyltransferase